MTKRAVAPRCGVCRFPMHLKLSGTYVCRRAACGHRPRPVKERRTGRARRGPEVDERRLDWIRCLPCIICFAWLFTDLAFAIVEAVSISGTSREHWISEAAHVGDRGLSQKCSARETVPLCAVCHRTGIEAHHGKLGKGWWAHHRLERDQVIKELNRWYERQRDYRSARLARRAAA